MPRFRGFAAVSVLGRVGGESGRMGQPADAVDAASAFRATPVAVAIVAVVLLADLLTGSKVVLVGLLSAAPLLAGLGAASVVVLRLGCAVIVIALASVVWNDSWGSWSYWVPLTVVTLAAVFGWRMAVDRAKLRRDAARTRVLAELSHLGHGR